MNKIIIALGVALVTATSAFADSSALDVVNQDAVTVSSIDRAATGSIGGQSAYEERARLGDGSPAWFTQGAAGKSGTDYSATGSIGGQSAYGERARLGDGSPAWF
jgi:hypothetical protein